MSRVSHTSSLQAMSTTIVAMSVGLSKNHHQQATTDITAEVEMWQEIFSRFRPLSLLSQINAASGQWVKVNSIFLNLLETAHHAVVATEGRFNPAILPALEANGYDRTIAQMSDAAMATPPSARIVYGKDTWTNIDIDHETMRVRLPEGMRIDFGGIAKGALADRLAERYSHWPGGAISIGGDMRVWGDPPDGDSWRVGIEHPRDSQRDIATIELSNKGGGAIATSSRTRRVWQTAHGSAHHLIDPATGAPADSALLAVSVCAPTAAIAEVVTKNLMMASAHGALSSQLLLDAEWALTVSDTLDLSYIAKDAA